MTDREQSESRCEQFGRCDLVGMKELMKCGYDSNPVYVEGCKRRKCLSGEYTNSKLQDTVK